MKHVIVSIKDNALDAYLGINIVRAPGEAMRNFTDIMNDPQAKLGKHPQDFDLYKLGTFDDNTGRIDTLEQPERLSRGIDVTQQS